MAWESLKRHSSLMMWLNEDERWHYKLKLDSVTQDTMNSLWSARSDADLRFWRLIYLGDEFWTDWFDLINEVKNTSHQWFLPHLMDLKCLEVI